MTKEEKLLEKIKSLENENLALKNKALQCDQWKKQDELNLQFKTIFSQSPDSISQIDGEGFIISCNKAFADEVGLSVLQTIQKHAKDFVVDKGLFKKSFQELKSKGFIEIELDQIDVNGLISKVWRKAVVLKDKGNKFNGAIIFNRDISKRKEQERVLIESEEKFRAIFENSPDIIIFTRLEDLKTISVNKTFTKLTGYTLKDVQNKLASELNIWVDENEHQKLRDQFAKNGYVDNFKAVLRTKTGEEYHVLISIKPIRVNGVNHIIQIINDILDISKIEVGELSIVKNELNVNVLLSELKAVFITQIKTQKKVIQLSIKKVLKNKKSVIYSDKFRIYQILNNLIGNALKFTDQGIIKFGYHIIPAHETNESFNIAKRNTKRLLFFVKDSGTGIPIDKQGIVFDRFRQSDDSSTKVYGGTGLGLSISQGLVQILGGEIWLKSELGKGSTFYFTLPFESKVKEKQISL